MIDAQGNVKIMDFGIARSMEAGTRLTGSMVGTPAYMAPEQVAGKPVDYRTDIYSLGLILYEMFTGAPAFTADNSIAVALKQMREEPPPPHEIEPAIPAGTERAILKCLEKDPAKRFQSIVDLESNLRSESPVAAASANAGHGEYNCESYFHRRSACYHRATAGTQANLAIRVGVFRGAPRGGRTYRIALVRSGASRGANSTASRARDSETTGFRVRASRAAPRRAPRDGVQRARVQGVRAQNRGDETKSRRDEARARNTREGSGARTCEACCCARRLPAHGDRTRAEELAFATVQCFEKPGLQCCNHQLDVLIGGAI